MRTNVKRKFSITIVPIVPVVGTNYAKDMIKDSLVEMLVEYDNI